MCAMLVLPQLVDLAFQDINLTLESCCVCHLATLIAHITLYSHSLIIYSSLINLTAPHRKENFNRRPGDDKTRIS